MAGGIPLNIALKRVEVGREGQVEEAELAYWEYLRALSLGWALQAGLEDEYIHPWGAQASSTEEEDINPGSKVQPMSAQWTHTGEPDTAPGSTVYTCKSGLSRGLRSLRLSWLCSQLQLCGHSDMPQEFKEEGHA